MVIQARWRQWLAEVVRTLDRVNIFQDREQRPDQFYEESLRLRDFQYPGGSDRLPQLSDRLSESFGLNLQHYPRLYFLQICLITPLEKKTINKK